MASIFLSYAHQDQGRAIRIAEALEQAGHQVWWDRNIRAGRRFSVEIDEALTSAEWIVVLWSKTSIVSPWVQDEAAVGRDSGRLIPALLDNVVPPLGFRQYQSFRLPLSARGTADEAVRPLLEALSRSNESPPSPLAAREEKRLLSWRQLALVAGMMILLIGGGLWWWRSSGRDDQTVSVTASADADPALSSELARQVVIDLGRFPGGQLSSLSFDSEARKTTRPAAFRATIAAQRDHDIAHVDISLMVRHRPGIAWATTIDGRVDRLVDLRQRIAAYLSAALGCATHYDGPAERLTDEVFRSFLTGCIGLENADGPLANTATFKSVTAKAPDFGPGWANLALLEAQNIPDVSDAERPAFIANMRAHLARAKQLAPNLEETLAADALIRRPDQTDWAHSLPMLDKAILRIPNSSLLLSLRADELQSVGRMAEAVESMRRALNAEPLTPGVRSEYIGALAFSGQPQAAEAELSKAEAIWPETDMIRLNRYIFELRSGDPRIASKMLEAERTGSSVAVAQKKSWQTFLAARIDPSPANIDAALASFRDRYRRDPADIPAYAQALGTFRRLDEFFIVARNPVTLDSMTASTATLFRIHMKPILHDPRFIELANRLGLLAFWRSSRAWPDFCQDPDLPYDCRAEAAKYH